MQNFSFLTVGNTRLALYMLSLRNPDATFSALPGYTYIFPLSPQNVRKEPLAMVAMNDVAGQASSQGVQRIFDIFGKAPPIYTIRGTTGFNKHSMDGFIWAGLDSILRLQNIIDLFFQLNATQAESGLQPYTLEFYDFFLNEYWQVVPFGPQTIEQDAKQPVFATYTLRLACGQKINDPLLQIGVDAVGALLTTGAAPAVNAALSACAALASLY